MGQLLTVCLARAHAAADLRAILSLADRPEPPALAQWRAACGAQQLALEVLAALCAADDAAPDADDVPDVDDAAAADAAAAAMGAGAAADDGAALDAGLATAVAAAGAVQRVRVSVTFASWSCGGAEFRKSSLRASQCCRHSNPIVD
jgi:hypothetical protein